MPYIKHTRRAELLEEPTTPKDAGELNYILTLRCLDYLAERGTSYKILNEIVGVLECAKQEFYRRAVVPYEDEKIKQNGDCY